MEYGSNGPLWFTLSITHERMVPWRIIKSIPNRLDKNYLLMTIVGNNKMLTFIACIFFLMASMVTRLGEEVNQVVQGVAMRVDWPRFGFQAIARLFLLPTIAGNYSAIPSTPKVDKHVCESFLRVLYTIHTKVRCTL